MISGAAGRMHCRTALFGALWAAHNATNGALRDFSRPALNQTRSMGALARDGENRGEVRVKRTREVVKPNRC